MCDLDILADKFSIEELDNMIECMAKSKDASLLPYDRDLAEDLMNSFVLRNRSSLIVLAHAVVKKKRHQRSRGKCRECGYSFRLRKDGTLQSHSLFVGHSRLPPCVGSGKPPK